MTAAEIGEEVGMDYRKLLLAYIEHVIENGAVDFIIDGCHFFEIEKNPSTAEYEELKKLAQEVAEIGGSETKKPRRGEPGGAEGVDPWGIRKGNPRRPNWSTAAGAGPSVGRSAEELRSVPGQPAAL